MKKVLVLSCFAFLMISNLGAQETGLKKFKVDLSLGYALPGGSGSKAGVLFAIEPKYSIMDSKLALGLRMEAAVIARFSGYDANGDELDLEVKAAGSYLATADYYFSENYSFRPFAGAGVGIFRLAQVDANTTTEDEIATGTQFGGMIRGGFEAGHFRLGIEYNIVPKSDLDGYDQNGNPAKIPSVNSYLGLKIGVCIGGGRW